MSFVVLHQRAGGSDTVEDVNAFTLDTVGVDKLRHPGYAPLLVESTGLIVWAKEGKEVGEYSAPPVPLGFDPVTGQPIFDKAKLKPSGFDPVTGQPIFPAAANVSPAPAPAPVTAPVPTPVEAQPVHA